MLNSSKELSEKATFKHRLRQDKRRPQRRAYLRGWQGLRRPRVLHGHGRRGGGRRRALLQLRRRDVRVGPAAERGVAVRVVPLCRGPLWGAPKSARRQSAGLRRQVSVPCHLSGGRSAVLSLGSRGWKGVQRVLGSRWERERGRGLGEGREPRRRGGRAQRGLPDAPEGITARHLGEVTERLRGRRVHRSLAKEAVLLADVRGIL